MKKWLALGLVVMLLLSVGSVYAEGENYITDTPVTLKVLSLFGAATGDKNNSLSVDEIEKELNITLEFTMCNNAEQFNLMVMNDLEQYDILFYCGYGESRVLDLIDSEDLLAISDYFDEMPNWKATFEKHPALAAFCTYKDGKVYYLPGYEAFETNLQLRDLSFINKNFLDQLNMAMPTTIEEFTDYLRAVKANAGTGCIPADVYPLISNVPTTFANSLMNIFAWFGAYQTLDYHIEGGKVVENYTSEYSKEALKWMQSIYKEGLLAPETFTMSNSDLGVLVKSENAIGATCWFSNNNVLSLVAMPALKTGTGMTPYLRRQAIAYNRNCMVTAYTQYPEICCKFLDYCQSEMGILYGFYGMKGHVWDLREDGTYRKLISSLNEVDECYKGWNNFGVGLVDDDFVSSFTRELFETPGQRYYDIKNTVYDWICPAEVAAPYPNLTAWQLPEVEDNELTIMKQAWNDAKDFANTTYATWITTEADIDAEWDGFVKQFKDNWNWAPYFEYLQTGYENYIASM